MSSGSLSLIHGWDNLNRNSLQDGLRNTVETAFSKDNHYTLFRYEDWHAWVTFTIVFLVLIFFDNFVMNRNMKVMTFGRAIIYTLFWILMACCFCGWVYVYYGSNQAFMWMSGYMLEWMLSFDNLFVFHLIFSVYGTPDRLKHRPLYLGILGAVVFRLIFIFVGEYLMHAMFFMHFIFGAFLVYTGFKTACFDDEDEDPSQQPLVKWLMKHVPFVNVYDEHGHFFVRVNIDDKGQPELAGCANWKAIVQSPDEAEPFAAAQQGERQACYGSFGFTAIQQKAEAGEGLLVKHRTECRATMLFLVLICIEISDLLFAVDSVSAIVAQVNDLFLAYTSAVFAMLGLRASFFIVDELVHLFSLLKYGVAVVLTFIGLKLILGRIYHISPGIVCIVLISAIGISMVASVVKEEIQKKADGYAADEVEYRVAKVISKSPSPFASPAPRQAEPSA